VFTAISKPFFKFVLVSFPAPDAEYTHNDPIQASALNQKAFPDFGQPGSTRASSTSATHPAATDDGTAVLPSWHMIHTSLSLLTHAASLILESSAQN
jgi:hypothetical protein